MPTGQEKMHLVEDRAVAEAWHGGSSHEKVVPKGTGFCRSVRLPEGGGGKLVGGPNPWCRDKCSDEKPKTAAAPFIIIRERPDGKEEVPA